LGRAEAEQELLGALESPHPHPAGADSLEHVRVRARSHRQVVLTGEPQCLVVVGLEKETSVVDLEDVDVREVTLEGRRVGNRVHAVKGMREIDQPVLLLDCRHGVGEGEAARDLLTEEQPDHLSLAVRLHLLAQDDDKLVVPGECARLERAAEHVVVGDGDRAEPDRLGVHDQVGRVDGTVV
jgi:hypothetical protein